MQPIPGRQFVPTDLPSGRVPVMFQADWCGYCARFLKHLPLLPKAHVVDITDESDPLWDAFDIQVVPTVILFEDGRPVRKWAGVLGPSHAEDIAAAVAAGPSSS